MQNCVFFFFLEKKGIKIQEQKIAPHKRHGIAFVHASRAFS